MSQQPTTSPRDGTSAATRARTTGPAGDAAAADVTGRGPGARRRDRSIPVYVRPAGRKNWSRGHALWVDDVLTVRARTAPWREMLFRVTRGRERAPTSEERWWIHRHGGGISLATFLLRDGGSVDVATRREHAPTLFGSAALQKAG